MAKRVVKSQSEADGSDYVQSSGSPDNKTRAERDAPLTAAREARSALGIMCPQCHTKMAEHQWGYQCERPGCRTVVGDPWSGRPGASRAKVYACVQCGGETEDRYYAGGGYLALCGACELHRATALAERVIANPNVSETFRDGMRRFLADAQGLGARAILTFTQSDISPSEGA